MLFWYNGIGQRYRPIWVWVSVLDLNQNSGLGHTLISCSSDAKNYEYFSEKCVYFFLRVACLFSFKTKVNKEVPDSSIQDWLLASDEQDILSRSAHRTPNFTNPEFQFPQFNPNRHEL
jgi:hypothetical protein